MVFEHIYQAYIAIASSHTPCCGVRRCSFLGEEKSPPFVSTESIFQRNLKKAPVSPYMSCRGISLAAKDVPHCPSAQARYSTNQPEQTSGGSGSCTAVTTGCKSCWLWYLPKLKTNNKPSRQFFSACLLCMIPTFNTDKDSGWYVQMMCWWHDNLPVILSVFNSTLDLLGKKLCIG